MVEGVRLGYGFPGQSIREARMNVLRRHLPVRSLVSRPHRRRAAIFLVVCTLAAAGGGFAWARAASSDAVAGAAQQPRVLGTAGPPVADKKVSLAAATPEVLETFRSAALAAGGGYLFAPTELPTDCRVVSRPSPSGDPGEPGQDRPSVVLAAGRGYLAFYDAMAGDLENLPSTECGWVDGHAATVYRVLGGDLVQWEVDGVPHGVFGWALPRAVVLRVAMGMRRVSPDARKHLSEP